MLPVTVTVSVALPSAALKAVEPPVPAVRSAVPPTVPLVSSQARSVSVIVPRKLLVGTKRIWSALSRSKAAVSATAGKAVQLVPPSSEYCQAPWPVVRPATAIPVRAPGSGSEITGPKMSPTRSPYGLGSFSLTKTNVGVVDVSRIGAWFGTIRSSSLSRYRATRFGGAVGERRRHRTPEWLPSDRMQRNGPMGHLSALL